MSYLASTWVEEAAPTADVYERMILMIMAARADHDGSGVYRSIPRLARACHCDAETVKRRLKTMLKRKLIGYGDQSRAAHIDKRYRPKVYDLLIPHSWFSAQQLADVNREREENGLAPLTPQMRPEIVAAPARRRRADQGVSNPKRSPKKQADDQGDPNQGALAEPPGDPVDNSPGGSERAVSGGSLSGAQGALTEPQIRPYDSVPKKSVRPDAHTNPAQRSGADGRTDDFPTRNPDGHPGTGPATDPAAGTRAAAMLAAPALQADLRRIDLLPAAKPHQRKQFAQLQTEVDRALLRFAEPKVARYLALKARDAMTVTWLLRAFSDYSDAIADLPDDPGPPRASEPLDDDPDAKAKADPPARKAAAPPVQPADEPDLSSPVSWLSDAQFASLSPRSRGFVRAAGETPMEDLDPYVAGQIGRILHAVSWSAA
ncbi:hypothetical protein L3Q65_00565 (plasmid) [Amycolatopsis sp. FU40]|uniref:hypothetical protein n=1 Tax=Amycolatopsis sp. FU40 TaxID=2914159 RepID=UPI001F47D54D|nr:hypothetical protein [Amycolatopsis sp. FU40]UKD50821.1 hypothetical protein L3Q65_00565 [Amycolatopsis sp. FU40]